MGAKLPWAGDVLSPPKDGREEETLLERYRAWGRAGVRQMTQAFNWKRYLVYLVRWQLTTPILAVVLMVLGSLNVWLAAIIANLIGGLIFYWVDRFIFTSRKLNHQSD